jgi:poly-gamma-glutamate capsule biosynthesis protein CapA/YwtB (metallophosphatase superfamily)
MLLQNNSMPGDSDRLITLFLAGDVMTGRGIDQILPHPGHPELHEPYAESACDYVRLAERISGPIPKSAGFAYVWGDALAELARIDPDLRIVNLETAITTSGRYWFDKNIHYRMHPANLPCLQAAGIDGCVLANNHLMDWGREGLTETLAVLAKAGIGTAGAGSTAAAAASPAKFDRAGKGRVLVFGFGCKSSGIPGDWAATPDRSGVNLLPDLSPATVGKIGIAVRAEKKPGDVAIASIHWGANWGYEIPLAHREFAHRLIDEAGIDLVHGHSSHHCLGMEVYRGKLILYGCGDFLNDYESIGGYEAFRGDLVLMYFPVVEPMTGTLRALEMVPLRIRRFRLERPPVHDERWLCERLDRECRRFGAGVEKAGDHRFRLGWP